MAHTGIDDSSQELSPGSPFNSSQGICAICLGVPDNKSFASNCLHEFCFVCILEWSKVKAECPLCMQPLCSIIHNVKNDHEYDEMQIQKSGKHSSRAFQSHVLLLQRQSQHNSTLAYANNAQGTPENHLQTPAISGRRQTIQNSTRRHNAVPPQSEQQLIVQNHLAKDRNPRERNANTIRYSLRSRTILRDDIDRASNIELVNEFRPISSSSITDSNMLLVSNVTADPAQKVLFWQDCVTTDIRNVMVQKLVVAVISDPIFEPHNHMEMVIAYMRRMERSMYMTALSEHLYFAWCSEKITELQSMDQTRKRSYIQLIKSYEGSALQPELNCVTSSQETDKVCVIPEFSMVSDQRHFPMEDTEVIEDDDITILDVPPKPVPEVITLSDSDDD
ncbi:hypothetical protein GHT06_016341 [Daphnia sinensis]|uniref:E3 ubiquitin-protein ligase Topors n=1 Tax=Daphnia sinensis TaxID=1820382 RepID=A0AAD5KN93_9CRUS|nr:hypothetical protein GHT06_016341 [Daphnia sinensis]